MGDEAKAMEKVIVQIQFVEEVIGIIRFVEEVVITRIKEVMGKTKLKTMTKATYDAIIDKNTSIMLPNAKTHEGRGFKKQILPEKSMMMNQPYYL